MEICENISQTPVLEVKYKQSLMPKHCSQQALVSIVGSENSTVISLSTVKDCSPNVQEDGSSHGEDVRVAVAVMTLVDVVMVVEVSNRVKVLTCSSNSVVRERSV